MTAVSRAGILVLLILIGTVAAPSFAADSTTLKLDLADAHYVLTTVPGAGEVGVDSREAGGPVEIKRKSRVTRSGQQIETIRCRGTRRKLHGRQADADDSKGYWDTIRVTLPADRPLDLELVVHRGESDIDFGKITLTGLRFELLSGDHDLRFGESIPGVLDRVTARASRGDFHLSGLANLHAREFRFKGSAGDFDLKFDGEWSDEIEPRFLLHASMGDLNVTIPRHVRLLDDSSSHAFMGSSAKEDIRRAKRLGDGDEPALLVKMRMTMGDSSLNRF